MYSGIYRPESDRILVVGDGDFSFSLSVARSSTPPNSPLPYPGMNMFATSHESEASVMATYQSCAEIVCELRELGVTVLHDIDATSLQTSHAKIAEMAESFDYLVWNFPCVSSSSSKAADGQVQEIEDNKNLLRAFFRTGKSFLSSHGEIHVVHKTIEPFSWWDIVALGREAGLQYLGSVVFDRCLYPGYVNRKVKDRKSFPLHDARTFIFGRAAALIPRGVVEFGLVSMADAGVESRVVEAISTLNRGLGVGGVGANDKKRKR